MKNRRKCLRCDRLFLSSGSGNRLCNGCNQDNKTKYTVGTGYVDRRHNNDRFSQKGKG